jgi:hypothetical protein
MWSPGKILRVKDFFALDSLDADCYVSTQLR